MNDLGNLSPFVGAFLDCACRENEDAPVIFAFTMSIAIMKSVLILK